MRWLAPSVAFASGGLMTVGARRLRGRRSRMSATTVDALTVRATGGRSTSTLALGGRSRGPVPECARDAALSLARTSSPSARSAATVGSRSAAVELLAGIVTVLAAEADRCDDERAATRLVYLTADVMDAKDDLS